MVSTNSPEMLRIVDAIARERNVDKEALFNDIEQAMISAARKHFAAAETEEFACEIDRFTGQIHIYRDGGEIPLSQLGRIPAQTAKQVMIQKFREDERASIHSEFSQRIGEIITGTAQRYEGGALVVQIGRAEGFMPRSEQIPGEQHMPGERVRCMILDVRDTGSQVKIVLSRGAPEFIRRLFEVEVPEVSERIIEIKALAREPGHRTKVAVSSIDSKVDAVGACVGVRGSRIKNIVDELAGEKIDIVRYNESSQVLIANALRPAEVVEISLCFELRRATVVVNEDQLSLAIGKRGQNVRLAARLTGWDVDILTPAEFAKGLDILDETLRSIEGITEDMIDRLAALGLITVFDVEELGSDVLLEHLGDLGMSQELAERAVQACSERGKEVAEQQQREREEAEQRKAEAEAGAAGDEAEAQAAAILGHGTARATASASAQPTESGGAGSGDIMDLLGGAADASGGEGESAPQPTGDAGQGQQAEPVASDDAGDQAASQAGSEGSTEGQETPPPEDRPHDVALADEQARGAEAGVDESTESDEQDQLARLAEEGAGEDRPAGDAASPERTAE